MPPLLADFTHARPCKPFCEKYLTLPFQRNLHGHSLSVIIDGNFHLPFLHSDFFGKSEWGGGDRTGDKVRAMLTRCSGSTGMKKRPDSRKLFERKNSNIHLQNDNFRTGYQTEPVR